MAKVHTILLVIFPGQGHINPALEFAKRLIREGVRVNLLTANSVHNRISENTPPEGLTFSGFSDGYDDGWKLTSDVAKMFDDLKGRGSEAVEKIIKSSIEKGQPFSHVVYTTLIPWAGYVAHAYKIPSTLFMIQPATVFDIFYYYFNGYGDTIRNSVNDPDMAIDLPGLPPRLVSHDLPSMVVDPKGYFGLSLMKEHLELLEMRGNSKVLVNTFDELEFDPLRAVKKLNLVPIGPLVKDPLDTSFAMDLLKKSQDYMEWLNSKEKNSVVYVSFGSYSELPRIQTEEIAKGLIECERCFLWVIRKDKEDDKEAGMDINLIKEIEKKGKLVEWCAQVEVLSHPSIGCFVTHCGWNSCLEALVCGVPIVGFPLWIDQGTNAKLMEGVFEVGVRVKANEERVVEGSEVKRCVDIVMGVGGEGVRRNAEKWKALAGDVVKEGGSSYLNFKSFISEIKDV